MSTITWLAKELARVSKELEQARALAERRSDEFRWALMEQDNTVAALRRDVERLTAEKVDTRYTMERLREQLERCQAIIRGGLTPDLVDGMDYIPGIKTIREQGGYGLKEAKDLIDGWIQRGSLNKSPEGLLTTTNGPA